MDYYDDLFFALATPVPDFHRRTHVPIYYGIQFNRSGRLRLRIGDGEMLDLEGAWVFITHPGCRFEYELAGARPHHYRVICFNGAAVGRYIEHGYRFSSSYGRFEAHASSRAACFRRDLL